MNFLIVLGAGDLRQGVGDPRQAVGMLVSPESPCSWLADGCLRSPFHTVFLLCVCGLTSAYKDTSLIGLGPALMGLF